MIMRDRQQQLNEEQVYITHYPLIYNYTVWMYDNKALLQK